MIAWDSDSGRDHARLAHPLFGEAVREQMPPSRVRELYRRLVALDADRPSRSFEDLLRRAVWVFGSDAPVTPASAEDLVKGAQVAAQSRDFVLAESLARRAASVDPMVALRAQ